MLRILVHVPVGILASLARVALATDTVHRDGERLMGFEGDTTEAHGTGREAFDDLARRLYLRQIDLWSALDKLQLAAQRAQLNAAHRRVAERCVRTLALVHRCLLQGSDRGRFVNVTFATRTPMELARVAQDLGIGMRRTVHQIVPLEPLAGQHLQTDAADARLGAAEAEIDHIRSHAHGFEDLGALVRLQRRDAHLGHHLQDTGLDGRRVCPVDGIVG
uniref:Putative secreted protein n=1 Tax=Anopheles triannulatus TaxID=58253 RepID=A0A2M4B0I0_9DIPT